MTIPTLKNQIESKLDMLTLCQEIENIPDCIAIYAVDWNCYEGQHPISEKRVIATAWVVGILVDETEDSITIAQTMFDHLSEREVRYAVVIPKVCIKTRINLTTKTD